MYWKYLVIGRDQTEEIIDRRRRFKKWVSEMPEEELESIETLFMALRNHGDSLGPI